MASGDRYKMALVGHFGLGQQFVVDMHYVQVGASTAPGAEALAGGVLETVVPGFLTVMCSADVLDVIQVRQANAPATEGFDQPVAEGGSLVGVALPPMDCPVVTKSTGLIGRAFRGRMYFPAPTVTAQSAGTLEPSFQDLVQTVGELFLNVPAGDGSSAVFSAGVFHKVDESITILTGVIARQIMGTQRRRRVGVGS